MFSLLLLLSLLLFNHISQLLVRPRQQKTFRQHVHTKKWHAFWNNFGQQFVTYIFPFIFIIHIYIYNYVYKSKTCTDTYVYIYIDILYSFDIYPTFLVTFMIAIFLGLSAENPGKRSADLFFGGHGPYQLGHRTEGESGGGSLREMQPFGHGCEWNHLGLNSNRILFPSKSIWLLNDLSLAKTLGEVNGGIVKIWSFLSPEASLVTLSKSFSHFWHGKFSVYFDDIPINSHFKTDEFPVFMFDDTGGKVYQLPVGKIHENPPFDGTRRGPASPWGCLKNTICMYDSDLSFNIWQFYF